MPSLFVTGPMILVKEDFINFINVFLLFRNYLPLKRGVGLHFNKLESPSPQDPLFEIGYAVLEKIFELCQCILAMQ